MTFVTVFAGDAEPAGEMRIQMTTVIGYEVRTKVGDEVLSGRFDEVSCIPIPMRAPGTSSLHPERYVSIESRGHVLDSANRPSFANGRASTHRPVQTLLPQIVCHPKRLHRAAASRQ